MRDETIIGIFLILLFGLWLNNIINDNYKELCKSYDAGTQWYIYYECERFDYVRLED